MNKSIIEQFVTSAIKDESFQTRLQEAIESGISTYWDDDLRQLMPDYKSVIAVKAVNKLLQEMAESMTSDIPWQI